MSLVLFGPLQLCKMKWCYPAHAWALDSGTSLSPPSSEREDAAFRNHPFLRSRLQRLRRRNTTQQPDGSTIAASSTPSATPVTTPSSWPPPALSRRAHQAPATPGPALLQPGWPATPPALLFFLSSFLSLFSSLSVHRRFEASATLHPHTPNP
ncbi:uncharacterized protein LOC143645809 [Tamandua tetradactyla]|uniref:uncharacterized protein LOC143645809 n=1 Tax=Tamandua tetradactyla TaxID=48850 RepID=UPI004053E3B8